MRPAPAKAASKTAKGAKSSAKGAKGSAKGVKRSAKVTKTVAHAPAPARHLALRLARKLLKRAAAAALESGAEAVRGALESATASQPGSLAPGSLALNARQIPIQCSIDVAVPVRVAWDQWMQFEAIPEGIGRVVEIEREGDELFGTIGGRRTSDWSAEITDQRERQSFAWVSHEGSDCAGVITFHALARRLTRIELDLDVQPTSIGQGVTFNTRLADRRAQADLRRFKARLEFLNPDIYEADGSSRPRSGGSKRSARRKKVESKGDA